MGIVFRNNGRDSDKIGAAAHQNHTLTRHVGGEPIGAMIRSPTISRNGLIANGANHWRDCGDELGLP
jgi:hypothetical protein